MKCVAPVCSGSTNGSKRLPVALWSKPASKFLGIEMFLELPCTTSSQGLWGHQQTWLSLPSISWGFFHPAHIPGPQSHQPLPQWCCSWAAPQLPTALPCLAMALLLQRGAWCHGMGLALVPPGCSASQLGSGDVPAEPPASLGPWHFLHISVRLQPILYIKDVP